MKPRIERARAAGAVGVIATTDWTFANGRDWGSPTVPERINLKTALAFAPDVLRHPRWLLKYLRSGHLPDLSVPSMAEPRPTATNVLRYLRPVDAESDTDVGRHFLAARRMGWAVHAQRSHADR
jgi:hypothetical protein